MRSSTLLKWLLCYPSAAGAGWFFWQDPFICLLLFVVAIASAFVGGYMQETGE